ncbi:MAG: phospho-N-acetylmuramoyl-pentapeptide-transferase [Clostridiales bacterium]|nr:phospho-N-acetylmuramoyl-pentapeptide-transferase [Clostridiales bacterium]
MTFHADAAAFTFLAAALLTALLIYALLPTLQALKLGQPVREVGPRTHQKKEGTPTMGGAAFVLVAALLSLWVGPRDGALYAVLLSMVGLGIIGGVDDYLKVTRRHSLGLRARHKLFFQGLLGLFLAWMVREGLGYASRVAIPLTGYTVDLGPYYYLLVILMVLATANATNTTDGADGLLAGSFLPVLAILGYYSYWTGEFSLAAFSIVLGGALVGFLFWNAYPARIMMGDLGSMALGGALVAMALLTKTELWLLLYGLVFVVETLSVILQVFSFRAFGRRIFRMSPLHHHFELMGIPEPWVTAGFWAASAAVSAFSLWALMRGGL